MFIYQNLKIVDTITIGDVQYPLEWWPQSTADELAALGVTQVADPTPPDPNYFTHIENPDGSLTSTPIPLANVQAEQVAALSAACKTDIYSGFSSSALGAAYTYPFGDLDQTNLTGSVLLSTLPVASAAGWSTLFLCADANGVWNYRQHTQAQIQQAGMDAASTKLTKLVKNATKAAQVMVIQPSGNNQTDIDAVRAITWSS